MWLVWIAGGLASVIGAGYLFDKKIGKPLNDKLKAASSGSDSKKSVKKNEEADKKKSGTKTGQSKFIWLWLSLLAAVAGLIIWFLFRKPVEKSDTDFYAGALGIPIEEARKMTKAYLAGQWAAKKRNEVLARPDEVMGLKPTSVTATFGKRKFEFGGSYGMH